MATVDDIRPDPGNTSQDSKGSGSQKSMLELLSITDAAVKALNKSTRSSSSNGSHASKHADPLSQSIHSDRSVKSAGSGHSGQSAGSGHSGQSTRSGHSRQSDPMVQSGHSDKSVKSSGSGQSGMSRGSGQSGMSRGSGQSGMSQGSGQLGMSRGSGQLGMSRGSGQSAMSRGSGQLLQTDPFVQSGHSDRSVKSGGSGQSRVSIQSQQSQRSGRSTGSNGSNKDIKSVQPDRDASYDSGIISKTHTISEEKSKRREATPRESPTFGTLHERSSDESTTASDILIRSTMDKAERSLIENGMNGNASITSKCSKTSYGVENFNSSGPQKVKISKKHLKEVKSPFDEESPRDSLSDDGKVPSALLGTNSNRNGKTGVSQNGKNGGNTVQRKVSPRERTDMSTVGMHSSGKSFPKGIDSEHFKVDKVRKSAEKPYEDFNKNKPKIDNTMEENKTERITSSTDGFRSSHGSSTNGSGKPVVSNGEDDDDGHMGEPVIHFRSTPKYVVERHSPQKVQSFLDGRTPIGTLPERKNLLQDLEESIDIITTHAKDSSGSSSQPEIVTVPERIVTISAKSMLSPSSTISDVVVNTVAPPLVTYHSAAHRLRDDKGPTEEEKGKSLDESDVIPPALSRNQLEGDYKNENRNNAGGVNPMPERSQWFSKQVTGHGLQQGAPVSGHTRPDQPRDEDVQISHFKLSDKQKIARDCFAKRQGGPVRRIVQPRLVGHDSKTSSTSSTGELKQQQQHSGQSNDQVLTAAAAASAAVAATQPFLKAQYEMEAKMAEVLTKITELQEGGAKTESKVESSRIQQLETQLANITENRIDYMERLQEQQISMQAKLLSLTRESSSGMKPSMHHTHHSSSRNVEPNTVQHDMSYNSIPHGIQKGSRAFSKTTVHKSADKFQKYSAVDKEDSMSPLDTPNPRSRAPKPTIYDTSDMEYRSRMRSPTCRSSPKARSPKARSPKARSRSPGKKDGGILHQILATEDLPAPTRGYSYERPPSLQIRMY